MRKTVLAVLAVSLLTMSVEGCFINRRGHGHHNKACREKCKGLKGQDRKNCNHSCR